MLSINATSKERCFICGGEATFNIHKSVARFGEASCELCGASKVNSDFAHALVSKFTGKDGSLMESLTLLKELRIYEAASTGVIHDCLKNLPNYVCSEYFEEVQTGSYKDGVRCEDITNLTFQDDSFDLVITQDILEHVYDPYLALSEIQRILKPGGYHIFTVPFHEGINTVTRAKQIDGKIIHLSPPVHHVGRGKTQGALVFTDFGEDIEGNLAQMDFETVRTEYKKWYSPDEITNVNTLEQYSKYEAALNSASLPDFFKYNFHVFISQNKKAFNTGERFLPQIRGRGAYDHWHRYCFAADFIKDKMVLDVASGEGYGSFFLSNYASKVVGVDIDSDAVARASTKYKRDNLDYLQGSVCSLPFNEDALFDVVISFETVEHVSEDDQERFLKEIKRVLKKDGLLIMSTPNKVPFGRLVGCKIPFHDREFTENEYETYLERYFENIVILGQSFIPASYIYTSEHNSEAKAILADYEKNMITFSENSPTKEYLISLCSDANIVKSPSSFLMMKADPLFEKSQARITDLERELATVRASRPLIAMGLALKIMDRIFPPHTYRRRFIRKTFKQFETLLFR